MRDFMLEGGGGEEEREREREREEGVTTHAQTLATRTGESQWA